mmetsp:Transcript_60608/g.149041  ORF Transcript_60608/g.149041 Transcript_60608/m.149041 type:complete len:332 (-) Transcript_60608:670-1665(-)
MHRRAEVRLLQRGRGRLEAGLHRHNLHLPSFVGVHLHALGGHHLGVVVHHPRGAVVVGRRGGRAVGRLVGGGCGGGDRLGVVRGAEAVHLVPLLGVGLGDVVEDVVVVGVLAVQRHVEAHGDLVLVGHDGDEDVDDHEEGEGHDERVNGCEEASGELLAKELAAALHAPDLEVREEAEHEGPEEAAHAVHAPHVERVVPLHHVAQDHAPVAEDGSCEPDEDGRPRAHKAGGGGDGGEARDGADAGADEGGLPDVEPLDGHPDAHGHRGCDRRVDKGEGRLGVGREGGPAVETEPADPEEAGAEGHEGPIVGHLHPVPLLLGSILARAHDEH